MVKPTRDFDSELFRVLVNRSPKPRMSLHSGNEARPHEILSPIGAAGWGSSTSAGTRLERTVAIKVLAVATCRSPDVRQRFEREAKTISQLSHPPSVRLRRGSGGRGRDWS